LAFIKRTEWRFGGLYCRPKPCFNIISWERTSDDQRVVKSLISNLLGFIVMIIRGCVVLDYVLRTAFKGVSHVLCRTHFRAHKRTTLPFFASLFQQSCDIYIYIYKWRKQKIFCFRHLKKSRVQGPLSTTSLNFQQISPEHSGDGTYTQDAENITFFHICENNIAWEPGRADLLRTAQADRTQLK